MFLFLGTNDLVAQNCSCTNCGAFVGPLSNSTFEFNADGAVNNDLSNPAQGICGIEIDFVPAHIWSVEMTLTSPGGQTITLIGSQSFQIGVTGPLTWSIDFVPCGDAAMPDPGFNDVWDNNQNWVLANPYSGSYYPHIGCLEDFNTGTVDGNWTLTVDNSHPLSSVEIIDFNIIFCEDEGLECFECEADAGMLNNVIGGKACEDDPALLPDLFPIFSGTEPDSTIYGYTYIIALEDTIVGYDTIPDLMGYGTGEFTICGMSYLLEDSLSFPTPNNTVTVTTLRDNLTGINPSFCGAITLDCFSMTINPVDTILITETICLGDTLFVDTLVLDQTGIYQLDYTNELGCDSILLIDLTVQGMVISQVQDTACANEPYFFNDMWLESTGSYEDTLQTTAGCDSFVFLKFLRLDTIVTNLEIAICEGDSFPVGNIYFDSMAIDTILFTAESGCDSMVILDLKVLNPVINIAPVLVLDCGHPTVLIDASGSVGEALTFEWLDLINAGAGIVSGGNESILEVSLPGNYLLTVTDTLGGNQCDTLEIVVVSEDYLPPLVELVEDTINCSNSPILIETNPLTVITVYDWSGPNGFTSMDAMPLIDFPGDYTVTVTGTNGCTDSFTVNIEADTLAPLILNAAVDDTLTCSNTIVELSAIGSPETIAYHWTGPNFFDEHISNPTTPIPGDYTLVIEAINGCTSDTIITVFENVVTPNIQILEDTLGCSPDTVQLFGFSDISGSSFRWLGPNSFESFEQNPLITEPGFYGLTVTAPNGCTTVEFVNIMTDTEVPMITIIEDSLGCSPDTIIIQSFSSVSDSEFAWSGPSGFTANISNPEITVAGNYDLTVTAPNGCEATSSITIIANTDTPVITILSDTLGCLPDTIVLESFSDIGGSTYAWSGPSSFESALSNPEVTEPGIYILEVTAPNGCGSTASIEVEIDAEIPIISIIGDTIDCFSDTIVLASFSSIVGSEFLWSGPSGFSSMLSNPEVSEIGNYNLTVTAPNGCEATASFEVISNIEFPIVSIISDTLNCAPDTITLQSISSILGSTFLWSGPSGFSSGLSNPEITLAGDYDLTVTAPNGCEATSSITIIANTDTPIITILSDTLGCLPDTIVLESFSDIAGSTYAWSGPSSFESALSNPEVTEPGIYILEVTAPNGCGSTASIEVEIDAEIPIISIIGDTIDCFSDTIVLASFSSIVGSEFLWSGPSGFSSMLSNPEISETGNYNLTVTAPNGCEATGSFEVISNIEFPIVSIISDTLNCAPDTITLQSTSSILGSIFSWSGPSGFSSALSNPEITLAGDYDLTVTAPNGCETISSTTVEADEEVPVINIITDTLGCSPDTIIIQSFSSVFDSEFAWSGPSGFTANIPNPEITVAGNYDLTVTAPNGCEATSSITIIANTDTPIITILSDTLGCLPDTIVLESFSDIAGSIFSWTGPSGFESALSNPEITEPGTYVLEVTAPNGCESTASIEVEIDAEIPIISIIGDTIDCFSDTIVLASSSSIVGSEFLWSGPSGFSSMLSNPEVSETGDYNLTVTAPNGCEATGSFEVISNIEFPIVSIISDTLNCAPDTITLQSMSSILGSTFLWSGPSGFSSGLSNPEITLAGDYDLTVTAPNGCTTISSTTVEADEEVPVINIITDTLGCSPDTIIIQSFSSVFDSEFAWSGPSGFTANIPNPEITVAGNYDLTVTAPNGCEATSSITIIANTDTPIITILSDTLGCLPDTIVLESFSDLAGSIFSWTGPSGFESALSNPEITEPGTYVLEVTAPNGCESTASIEVEIDAEIPIISIIGDTIDCFSDTIVLASFSSIVGSEFLWSGPSGFSSMLSNPEISEVGTYDLIVTAPNGCEATSSFEVIADLEIPIVSIISDTLNCAPDTITLQSMSSILGSTFLWSGPSGFSSGLSNPEITLAGDYDLTVTAPNGCTTISSTTVEADEEVPVINIISDTLGCSPDTIIIQSFSSVFDSEFAWSGPSGFTANIPNPEITVAGNYDLTVTALNGCEATSSITIIANTDTPIITILSDTLGCLPDTIVLESFSDLAGSIFSWTGPSGFESALSNPEITELGTYVLEVTAPNGCGSTANIEVEIDAEIPIISIIGDTIDCFSDTIVLASFSSIVGSEFLWSGPSGFSSMLSNPEVSETGNYNLTVTAPNGCEATASFEVISNIEFPIVSIISDTLNCAPDTITLQSMSSILGSTFLWSGPSGFSSGLSNPNITLAGDYDLTVTAPNGCETISSTTVEADEEVPVINIISDTLGCSPDTIVVQSFSSVSDSEFAWSGPSGFTANIPNPEITVAGNYDLTVTAPNGCEATSSITIIANTDTPIITILSDTLGCLPDTIVLESFSDLAGSIFSWTGPSGFESALSNPEVTEPGIYILEVTAPNGCGSTASIEVEIDAEIPIISIIGDTIDCFSDTIVLASSSSIANSEFLWSGPSGFSSMLSNPEVSETGNYNLIVTAPNGCEATSSFELIADVEIPIVSIISDTLNCAPDTITLQSTSSILGSIFSWSGPSGFSSALSNPEITLAGDYDLTVTAPNGCETISSTTVEADEEVPVINIISDTLGCSPDTIVVQSFSSVSDSEFAWSGSSGFTANISNPEITVAGNYDLTVTAPNGCEATSSITIIANTDTPIITILSGTLGCLPDTIVLESFSDIGGSTYAWSGPSSFESALSNPEVTEPGIYILEVTAPNGCGSTASIEVEIDAEIPIISIIGDTIDCFSDTIVLASFSSIVGSEFLWSGPSGFSSMLSNPEVSETGDYNLTVTAPNGCEATGSFEVISNIEFPIVSIISDTLNCAPDTITLQGMSSILGSTFLWSGPSGFSSGLSNPEITLAGDYDLTVTAPNGCTTISSITVEADEVIPAISIINDTLGCAPDTIVLQSFSSISGSVFFWSGPSNFISNSANPEVTLAGNYELTVRAPNGCEAMASVLVEVDTIVPIVNAIGDTIDCTNDIRQLQGLTNVSSADFLWTGPGGFTSVVANPVVTQAGIYNLSVAGLNGCRGEALTELIDLSETVNAMAFVVDTLDCETTTVVIDGSASSAEHAIAYSWLDANNVEVGNEMTLIVNTAGEYTLIVNDSITSCYDTIMVEVFGDTIVPTANITILDNQSISCNNASVILSSDGSNPITNMAAEWFINGSSFSNQLEVIVDNPGEYVLEVSNLLNNCTDRDTFFVMQNTDLPVVEILPPDLINCIDTMIIIDASASSSGIDYNYTWTSLSGMGIVNGQNGLFLLVDQPGTYTLIIENGLNGCVDSASVIVAADLTLPVAVADVDELLDCFNQMVTLDGTGSSLGNLFEYQWAGGNILSGGATLNPVVNETGIYTLSVLNNQNGCLSTAEIPVEGIDDFITGANVLSVDPTCFEENDGRIWIDNVIGGTPPYFYTLGTNTTTFNIFEQLIAGTYPISISDAEGCTFDTTIILEQAIELSLNLGADETIVLGDSFWLDPQMNVLFSELDTFYWSQGTVPCDTCFGQWAKPFETSLYGLTIISQNGCVASDDILLRVQKDRLVFIPNVFTPNGDGINDLFMIYGGQDVAKVNTFKIFDRWGELVFQRENFSPNNPVDGWDGNLKDVPMNSAVFVYYSEIEFIDGRVEIYKGDFTLIRN